MAPTYDCHKRQYEYLMNQMKRKLSGISVEAGKSSPRVHVIEAVRAECQVLVDKLRLQHDWIRFRYSGEVNYDPDACRQVRNFMKIWLKQVGALVVVRFGLHDVE